MSVDFKFNINLFQLLSFQSLMVREPFSGANQPLMILSEFLLELLEPQGEAAEREEDPQERRSVTFLLNN